MILQVIGIIFLSAIVLAAAAASVYLFKGRMMGNLSSGNLRSLLMGPPPDITLVPQKDPRWIREPRAQAASRILQHLGFEKGETFVARERSGMRMMSFCCPMDHVLAVVHKHDGMRLFLELMVYLANGEEIVVTDAPHGGEMESRPGCTRVFLKKASVQDLVLEIRKRLMNRATIALSNERFPEIYRAAHRAEMEWRHNKGGVSATEVAAVAANRAPGVSAQGVENALLDAKLAEILRWESDVVDYLRHSEDLSVGQWTSYESSMILFSDTFQAQAYVHYLVRRLGIGEWLVPYYLELSTKISLEQVLRSVIADQRCHIELLANVEAPIKAQIFGLKRQGEQLRTQLRLRNPEATRVGASME